MSRGPGPGDPFGFKISRREADGLSVKATLLPPHQVRSNPRDLEALATVWKWEGAVQRLLPGVITANDLDTSFQAIFDVRGRVPVLRAYEAYARFPSAPRIPTGLWFAAAARMGLETHLSMASGKAALARLYRIPGTALLFVNASPEVARRLLEFVPTAAIGRVVFDLPGHSFGKADVAPTVDFIRETGAGVCFDDGPMAPDTLDRIAAVGDRLDFVKLDVLSGLSGTSLTAMMRRVSDWCHRRGIFLVAKRAEHMTELCELRDAGVDWAQGHTLSHPIDL